MVVTIASTDDLSDAEYDRIYDTLDPDFVANCCERGTDPVEESILGDLRANVILIER